MSLDVTSLNAALADHGPLVRVVIAKVAGSAPRELGASMLVGASGDAPVSGTIGGGALELAAIRRAQADLRASDATRTQGHTETHALGPHLGQCCGGSVTLAYEVFTKPLTLAPPLFARPIGAVNRRANDSVDATLPASPLLATAMPLPAIPLPVSRALRNARAGRKSQITLTGGWLIEPITPARQALWIYGAGHVGRALIHVLAPLDRYDITWVDTSPNRFPARILDRDLGDVPHVTALPAAAPDAAAKLAPKDAMHLILTYSHAMDLAICHALLGHGFHFAGLIGSDTKWARFKSRLAALGHAPAQVSRIQCPIGQKELGKHPAAIAIGVANTLILAAESQAVSQKERQDITHKRAHQG